MNGDRETTEEKARDLLQTVAKDVGDQPAPQEILRQLTQYFQQLRPTPFSELVHFLVEQQTRHRPGGRLFENIEDDLALWAHARAYGWSSQRGTELPEALSQGAEFVSPLLPPRIAWGASGHLQDSVVAALDSPVLHAWMLYRDNPNQPVEVVITGMGIPRIYQDVMAAVFSTSLAIEPTAENVINVGIMKIVASEPALNEGNEGSDSRSFFGIRLPFIRGDRSRSAVETEIPRTAAEAMLLLRGTLLRLQRDTGMVILHELNENQRDQFFMLLDEYHTLAQEGNPYYWYDADNRTPRVVTTSVYQKHSGRAVQLVLSADLLQTPTYMRLVDMYQNRLVNDVLSDVDRRERFYRKELEECQGRKDWFDGLSPEERQKVPPVEINIEIDFETALVVRMPRPKKVPAVEYYGTNVPNLIKLSREWLEKMQNFQAVIERNLHHPEASFGRLCAARLFDCAWRQRYPSYEDEINQLFDVWALEIQPVLWCEWRRQLQNRDKIHPEHICTRQSFLNVILLKEKNQIILNVHSVVDSQRSVIVFDAEHTIPVIRDATGFAESVELSSKEVDALANLEKARELAVSNSSTDRIRELLFSAMRNAPQKICQHILELWVQNWSQSSQNLEDLLRRSNRKMIGMRAASRALDCINGFAFNTADEILQEAEKIAPQAANELMRIYLECIRKRYDPFQTIRQMYDHYQNLTGLASLPSHVDLPWEGDPRLKSEWRRFLNAFRLNPRLVIEFFRSRRLNLTSFPDSNVEKMDQQEEGAALLAAALDTADIAYKLSKACGTLDQTSESRRSAYAKLGSVIERGWAPPFGLHSEKLGDLLELLLGEKLPDHYRQR